MEFEKTITPSAESIKIANRLKELRSKKELSFEQLKKVLLEEYDIKISVDSLKNYEITEDHIRANSNLGMRIEYLNCFADFYGVTTDYLLGRTDDPSPHPSAVDELGLSNYAISRIITSNPNQKSTIDKFLCNKYCPELLMAISMCTQSVQSESDYIAKPLVEQPYFHYAHSSEKCIPDHFFYSELVRQYPFLNNRLYLVTGPSAIIKQREEIEKYFSEIIDDITNWEQFKKLLKKHYEISNSELKKIL